jgi:hypothetical protein
MSKIKLKLKRVDPVKYGLIIGLLSAIMSLIVLIPMFLFMSALGASARGYGGSGIGAAMFGGALGIFMAPILYFIFGFIFGLIGTAIMNFILGKTNGLDIEFESNDLEISQIGKDKVNF